MFSQTNKDRKDKNKEENDQKKPGFGGFGQSLCKKCGSSYTSNHCPKCWNGGNCL